MSWILPACMLTVPPKPIDKSTTLAPFSPIISGASPVSPSIVINIEPAVLVTELDITVTVPDLKSILEPSSSIEHPSKVMSAATVKAAPLNTKELFTASHAFMKVEFVFIIQLQSMFGESKVTGGAISLMSTYEPIV